MVIKIWRIQKKGNKIVKVASSYLYIDKFTYISCGTVWNVIPAGNFCRYKMKVHTALRCNAPSENIALLFSYSNSKLYQLLLTSGKSGKISCLFHRINLFQHYLMNSCIHFQKWNNLLPCDSATKTMVDSLGSVES